MADRPVAIITGASSGIGATLGRTLAKRGYNLVLAARRKDRLEDVARRCGDLGSEALAQPADVTCPQQVDALVETAVEKFGRLDVMVNNAGIVIKHRLWETSEAEMRRLMDVNFMGVFFGCRAAAPVMIRQRRGHIFNVSSVLGKRGSPMNSAYCASKFAICGLTDSLRVELRAYGVRATSVCPTLTSTELFDKAEGGEGLEQALRRWSGGVDSAGHVARTIARTIGKDRAELVFSVSGRVLAILGAIAPGLTDRLMAPYYRDLRKR